MDQITQDLQNGYTSVAGEYADEYFGELARKPLDRVLLARFADDVRGKGPVCDLGCGPGQIVRYLRDCGVTGAFGVDLAPGMVEQARQLSPDIEFRQGNMRALDAGDGTWAGIAAFYSIIHIPRDEVTEVLRELRRVLQPGGLLLLTFHVGDEVYHAEELLGKPVSIDFAFFQREEMEGYLAAAGFEIEDSIQRSPYKGAEYPSQRAYLFARNPRERGG